MPVGGFFLGFTEGIFSGRLLVNMQMEEKNNKDFTSPSKGRRNFLQLVSDILEFVSEDVEAEYSIVVGSDSEQINDSANFVTVVTIHRVGKHGRYFWRRQNIKVFDRHDRILKEAYLSLELAQELVEVLRDKLKDRLYDFEIHLDIGHNGPTKQMIQEVVGMITGNGFVAKIKPDAYAANKVADRHC